MMLFPFNTVYLKTSITRNEIENKIISQTYLSDATYVKKDKQKTFFYGRVNDQGFILQNVAHSKLISYMEGNILGVDTDMFVQFRFKGFKSLRIFLLLGLIIIGSLSFVGFHLWQNGPQFITAVPVLIALALTVFLLFIILKNGLEYNQKLEETKDFFRGLLSAEEVKKHNIPNIFR